MNLKTLTALVAVLAFLAHPSPVVLPTPPVESARTQAIWTSFDPCQECTANRSCDFWCVD